MYVQPNADKMAASEYSRLVNTHNEANRMDPHNPHQMSPMYPGQKQAMYQSALRGSIQTGMPSVPHGMDMGKNHPHKSVASESNRRGTVGYSTAPHLVQRGGYPHGYQHQVNYSALPSAVTSETSPFHREHSAMTSHAEMMRSHNQMNQKSTNVFQTTHRSEASHLHKSYEQINHGFQSHIGSMPRLERGPPLQSHPTSVVGNIKDRNPGLKSHPQSYPSTQMHLNYQHESAPISGLPNHPSYVSMDRRHSANKHLQSSHIAYHERGTIDSQRLGPSNPLSAMPELIRVVDEPNSRIQPSLRQQGVRNQSHRMSQPHRTDHAVPSSIHKDIHKDHSRTSFPPKPMPSGQSSVFVNQDYSNSKMASSARVNPKDSQHGSIQTGIPLDLSRVPEKPQLSVNQKSSRDADSPLDLSVKTRKRCADTTLVQYSNEAGMISPKRQLVEHKQLPHNSINEHYRNDYQKSIDPVYLNQAVQQQHRQQAYPHLHKEPVTIKADNSAAKSAGLLPRLTPEQNRANIIYQNQKQLSSLKAQTAKSAQDAAIGGVSPYPYGLYPGNQPSVIRCSPDSTNAQIYQHHQQSKQVHQLLKRTPLTQPTNAAQYQQQSLHNQKVQSPKGPTRNTKVDTLHSNHPQHHRNQNFLHPAHTKAMSLPATSRSQQMTHPPPLESKPNHAEPRSANSKTSLPQPKSEPHMQLYPSYEKQSFTGTLPSNINLNRASSSSTSNIYKTRVKPPEIMGLPSTGTEKQIMNTIKSVRNDEKPKTDEPKNSNTTPTTTKVTESDLEQSDKYMEPLSIAIPFAKDSNEKSQKVIRSSDDKIIAPAPPKVLSRKQMIMNAVIKDENLKKYATPMRKPKAGSEFKTPRCSPASPPSPKMPILSPQQKSLPSVSPLHSDPPTLDLLENPGKHRLKGRISHTIPKRPLDKVKAPIVKIPTENQEPVPSTVKEEVKDTSYPRPEAIRRNSLPEKTWMYNKNIPVANVAPFIHSEVKEEKFPVVPDSQPTLPGSNNPSDKDNVLSSQDDEQKANSTIADTSPPFTNAKKKERSPLEKVIVKAKLKNISARKKLALEKVKNNIESMVDLVDSKVLTKMESNSAKVSRKSKLEKKVKSELPDGPSLEEDVAAIDDAEAAGNLMTDPALLDREERALRRAIDQFNKMETGTKYTSSATTVRRQSSTNKRAQELKKRAIKRNTSGRNKTSHIKGRSGLRSRGFIDFKPEVLKARTRPTDERQIRKKVSSSSKNQRNRSRPRHDSDFEFDNAELDFLDDDDDEEYDDDDDEDATEYEYDSDELSQDRVLRQRVSLRTRKRPSRHVDSDDTDTELDFQDDQAVNQSTKSSRTRRQQKTNSRAAKAAAGDAAEREETTDDDFDAAFFRHEESLLLIPAEVKKITINKTTGETGLHKAVRLNYQEAVLYYLKSGTLDVNVKDNAGYSPLHEACSTGNLPVAKILLRHGADVNSSSVDGIRPLHDAVRSDHIEVVRLLLAFGADPTIPDGRGKSLVEISELPGMLSFLEGFFGDLNGFDSDAEDNPWKFSSCYHSGPVENGCNIFSDIPSDPEQDLDDDLFDDDITSAIRIFDLDLYNIGRSESYVFGEDIQSQFNCNETRLRKLCTPEMDVIKLPTEKFQKFFDNSVVRCPLTNNPTICLIKYAYYKDLKEKLTPTTKCSNVSDLISYRNKATERKVLNRSLTHNSDSSTKNGKKNSKGEMKTTSVVKDVKSDTRQNKGHNSKYSLQQSSSCPSRVTADTNEASSSQNNNNNNNNNQVNNNINNMKKRQSHMSVQVVLKKEMLTSLSGKKSSKLESFKIRTSSTSSQESKNTNSKSISAVASSKYAFNDGDSN